MKVTLLGFTVTDDMVAEINRLDANMASQTHRFAWAIVAALRSAGVEVDLLSSVPVSDYPRNPRLLWRARSFEQHGVHGYVMPFVNALVVKHLSRSLSAWVFGMRFLRSRRPDWIVVHGVHTPLLWFAMAAAPLLAARVCVLVTDPPGVVTVADGRVRRLLKRIDTGLTRGALRRANSLVVLARPLAEDFAPGVDHIVMEGIYDPSAWPAQPQVRRSVDDSEAFVVTYAGGLSEAYGVADLVGAVLASDDPRLRLHLYGRGPLEAWIAEQAQRDHRVRPAKLLDPADLAAVYAASDVLVQPRPVDQAFVPYSFPSKLIEYIASGTPVISTRLPSIPEDYQSHVVWSDDAVEGLMGALRQVAEWTAQERREFGSRAARFMIQTRSTHNQGRRIEQFLKHGVTS